MKRRGFLWLGTALIGAGVLQQTGAFSSLNAGRNVSVNAVEDKDGALLGIKHREDGNVSPEFENNSQHQMDVNIDNDLFDPSEFSLPSGGTQTVEMNSSNSIKDVNITATLLDDGIEIGKVTLQRDFSKQVVFGIDGSIVADAPQGGQVKFKIRTNGNQTATVTGFDVTVQAPLSESISWVNKNSEIPDQFNETKTVLLDRFTSAGRGNSPANIVIDSDEFVSLPTDGDIIVTLYLEVEGEEIDYNIGIKASSN